MCPLVPLGDATENSLTPCDFTAQPNGNSNQGGCGGEPMETVIRIEGAPACGYEDIAVGRVLEVEADDTINALVARV